jgi:hypothetical protein
MEERTRLAIYIQVDPSFLSVTRLHSRRCLDFGGWKLDDQHPHVQKVCVNGCCGNITFSLICLHPPITHTLHSTPTAPYSPHPDHPPSSTLLLQNSSTKPLRECHLPQSQPKHLPRLLPTLRSKTASQSNPCTKATSANLGLKRSFSSTAPRSNHIV